MIRCFVARREQNGERRNNPYKQSQQNSIVPEQQLEEFDIGFATNSYSRRRQGFLCQSWSVSGKKEQILLARVTANVYAETRQRYLSCGKQSSLLTKSDWDPCQGDSAGHTRKR